jgi:hypothetical protein
MATLMDKEVDVPIAMRDVVGDEEQLSILDALLAMIAEEDKTRLGGSVSGRRKSKPRQRMEGYCKIYANYFADDPLHTAMSLFAPIS